MQEFRLVLGDWSDDGHGKSDEILLRADKPVKDLQDAYKASCKLTGISFNGNDDFTEIKREYAEQYKYQVCVDYEQNQLSQEVIGVLEKFKCPLLDVIKQAEHCIDQESFRDLLMWFIGLSLDFKWEFTPKEKQPPALNGWWNKNLNVGFGYGLYY